MILPMSSNCPVSPLCALCGDCVWLRLKGDQTEKKKESETGKCRAPRVEKMGSFTFFPYTQSEIFETKATIDGFAYFSLWGGFWVALFYSQWCHCGGRRRNLQHCHLVVTFCLHYWILGAWEVKFFIPRSTRSKLISVSQKGVFSDSPLVVSLLICVHILVLFMLCSAQ